MEAWGWDELGRLLGSVGVGVLSAIVPVINAEAYVVATRLSLPAGPLPIVVGVAVGQTLGKVLLFLGVRRGKRSRFVKRERRRVREVSAGPARRKLRRFVATLLALVGQKRWGLPIVLLAAVTGLPPLYAVALLAGATRMRVGWFAVMVLIGRFVRFLLVAQGVDVLQLR